jgi:hypothetical protein
MLGFMATRTMKKQFYSVNVTENSVYGSMQTYSWVNWMQATLT